MSRWTISLYHCNQGSTKQSQVLPNITHPTVQLRTMYTDWRISNHRNRAAKISTNPTWQRKMLFTTRKRAGVTNSCNMKPDPNNTIFSWVNFFMFIPASNWRASNSALELMYTSPRQMIIINANFRQNQHFWRLTSLSIVQTEPAYKLMHSQKKNK